jgi:aspartate/methionine/tyrosine aminotransferase
MTHPTNRADALQTMSRRAAAVAPFLAMDVMRAAAARGRAGEDIVHLEVGQPSASAPAPAIEAARRALAGSALGYTEALGLPALRERIAQHYADSHGLRISPERIVVTTGSSAGFVLAFLALFDSGARVLLGQPTYPAYRNILTALDIAPCPIAVGAAEGFQLNAERVEAALVAQPADGVLVASPANPTGAMVSGDALGRLAALCARRGLWLIADEIYHGITFRQPAETALAYTDSAVVINSFSKYFAMTGWRVGWMVVPEALVRTIERLAQNLFIAPPTLSQHAAIAALDAREELDRHVAHYAENRDLLLARLPEVGFETFAPADGAFYLYADIHHRTNDSEAFCRALLAETGIATTPGIDFDPERGRGFLRLSYAGSRRDVEEAIRRLRRWRGPAAVD